MTACVRHDIRHLPCVENWWWVEVTGPSSHDSPTVVPERREHQALKLVQRFLDQDRNGVRLRWREDLLQEEKRNKTDGQSDETTKVQTHEFHTGVLLIGLKIKVHTEEAITSLNSLHSQDKGRP